MIFHILLLIFSVHSIQAKKNLRILGGRNATENEFPYVVSLMVQSSSSQIKNVLCSGNVLASRWTLTAGHCVTMLENSLSSDDGGLKKGFIEYKPSAASELASSEILRMTAHPGYVAYPKNDVGLLCTQPVIVSSYAKLSPIDYSTLNGQEVFLVGYGMFKTTSTENPAVPQVLEAIVKDCLHSKASVVYPQMCFAPRCSAEAGQRSLCPGDSGGAVVHPSGVVAVNTMAAGAACGLYDPDSSRWARYAIGWAMPVSPFIDWISSIIKREVVDT